MGVIMTYILSIINRNSWVNAIRKGFLKVQSVVIISCFLIIFSNLKIDGLNNWSMETMGLSFTTLLNHISSTIASTLTLLLTITTSYSLARIKMNKMERTINPIIPSIVSLVIAILLSVSAGSINNTTIDTSIMLIVILISLAATEVYFLIDKLWYNKVLKNKLYYNIDAVINDYIESLLPAIVTIIIFIFIKIYLTHVGINDVFQFSMNLKLVALNYFRRFFTDGITYLLSSQIFWFIGIHGGNVFSLILDSSTKVFFDVFVNIGGAGTTLCLILATLITKSTNNDRKLSKIGLIPSLLNINEIIIYGLPVMLNPIYLIPFIITPFILTGITQLALNAGFVEIINVEINWMTPVFFNSYLATQNLSGVILQVINILIGILIYIPFVKISKKMYIEENRNIFKSLKEYIFSYNKFTKHITTQNNSISNLAINLGSDLKHDLSCNNHNLYLHYQPQVNKDSKIVGVEALLRWNHPTLGNIPPNIAVAIAEELSIIDELGLWILEEACKELNNWNKRGVHNIIMSVNISTTQIQNVNFADKIRNLLNSYNINPQEIKLEITENISISNDKISELQLNEIQAMGISLAIDDFGQGYNPILYILKYKISTIKLDGKMIENIVDDEASINLVKSMDRLCKLMNIDMIIECVETLEQKEILDKICHSTYQGYLFSKPLSGNQCLKYIQDKLKT